MPSLLKQIGGAIAFYTRLPLPPTWNLDFERIARWAPLIGLGLGTSIGLLDYGLAQCQMPVLTRSALVISLWVGATGGLHLDGVIDTADGLAVLDKDQRLVVMSDSRTGAFGVMAGSILVILKVCALSDLSTPHFLAIITAIVWGRFAQVIAIAAYPYLKSEGKGAFHKDSFQMPGDVLPAIIPILIIAIGQYVWQPLAWHAVIWGILGASSVAIGVSYWFYRQFQGMTGDVYGAIVEWTEALILCCFTLT